MDYKQHKGNLRGKIKDKVERKLYNKQIRAVGKNVATSEGQLTIPDVIKSVCTCIQTGLPCGFPCYPQCPLYAELDKQTVL